MQLVQGCQNDFSKQLKKRLRIPKTAGKKGWEFSKRLTIFTLIFHAFTLYSMSQLSSICLKPAILHVIWVCWTLWAPGIIDFPPRCSFLLLAITLAKPTSQVVSLTGIHCHCHCNTNAVLYKKMTYQRLLKARYFIGIIMKTQISQTSSPVIVKYSS